MRHTQQLFFVMLFLSLALFTLGASAYVLGDVDENGTVETADLTLLEETLLNGSTSSATDLNFDGITDAVDFQLMVLILMEAPVDRDNDGLPDVSEIGLGTNPDLADTDNDGLVDGDEVLNYDSDPFDTDSDDDGLRDGDEVHDYGSDPTLTDTDGDTLSDYDEVNVHGSDPSDTDSDDDSLPDADEVEEYGTRPDDADTDGDGLSDGEEIILYESDPLDEDSDDDGLWDGEEINDYGTDPQDTDSDNDGVSDGDEVALGQDPAASSFTILINEFLASNETGLLDEDNEYVDWIELYNPGSTAVPMEGWYLTDSSANPEAWAFPAVTIAPASYLVVFASGKDRSPTDGGNLHTNFELSDGGEYLALYKQDGETLSHDFGDEYPRQREDITYGLLGTEERYFSVPTPGAANNSAFLGYVEEPEFSVPHGFYEEAFSVALTCDTLNAQIRYTLDGTEPTLSNGMNFVSGNPIAVNQTTWIRAKAFKEGYQPSFSSAQTYLFLTDILAQDSNPPSSLWPSSTVNDQRFEYGLDANVLNDARYSDKITDSFLDIPSISLVLDLENLFDPATGIYVNAENDGEAWERPTSVELINPNGDEGFQINAGLRIRGAYSRHGSNPKHAFRLFFRDEYGDDTLNYPMFEDEGVDEFRRLDLRTAQNNSWSDYNSSQNTLIRDVFSRDLQREAGQQYARSRYYHLYINGVYWGIFQSEERPESRFAASYFGGDADDYDVPKAQAFGGIYAVDGNLDAYYRLYDTMVSGWDDENYYGAQGLDPDGTPNPEKEVLLDVENLVDYMLIIYYTGQYDAPTNKWTNWQGAKNFYVLYNRVKPFGMQYIVHDSEWSLIAGDGIPAIDYNCVGPFPQSTQNEFNPRWLHQELVNHPEYRMYFADRAHKHMANNGILTEPVMRRLWDARATELDLAIIAESARWGSVTLSRDVAWMNELNFVRNDYFPYRGAVVVQQLRDVGWYPVTEAPEFSVNATPQFGGHVEPGTELQLINPSNTGIVYYALNGADPRERVVAGGGGASLPEQGGDTTFFTEAAQKRVLVPTMDIGTGWTQANFDDSTWTSGTGGVGYDNSGDYTPYINIDLTAEMFNGNSGCYIRIPFTTTEADLANLSQLMLGIRWEDGFVAYLNGVKILERNAPTELSWNAAATVQNSDGNAVTLQIIDVSDGLSALVEGNNVLAIHGLNINNTSSDFLISPELIGKRSQVAGDGFGGAVSEDAVNGTSLIINERVRVRARVYNNGEWSPVTEAVFSPNTPASAENFAVTEINYHPHPPTLTELQINPDLAAGDFEFIEVMNISQETIDLDGVQFTDGVQFDFDQASILTLTPGQRIVIVDDIDAFTLRYGDGIPVVGEYSGNLSDGGEGIEITGSAGTLIQDFSYSDNWFEVTDGAGFTLIPRDEQQDASLWDSKDGWRPGSVIGGTPGTADNVIVPEPGAIVINEVLAHSHDTDSDWIELYNTTDSAIDLSGWFLSDNANNLKKYEIPTGVTIAALGYVVFREDTQFGPTNPDTPFAFSENGEAVYLSSGMNGELTGYSDEESFGASETGVSFGRYYKGSSDTFNFVAMESQTPGQANSAPKVGPIVISEIMYHPPEAPAGNPDAEYIELYNLTGESIPLWDTETSTGWQLSGGIEFDFPEGASIPANGRLLIVRDSTSFESEYPGVTAQKYIWDTGRLANGGERIEISKPGDVDGDGIRYFIRVDRVNYDDTEDWPTSADGQGDALHRTQLDAYGNDPANWEAKSPSPGS